MQNETVLHKASSLVQLDMAMLQLKLQVAVLSKGLYTRKQLYLFNWRQELGYNWGNYLQEVLKRFG